MRVFFLERETALRAPLAARMAQAMAPRGVEIAWCCMALHEADPLAEHALAQVGLPPPASPQDLESVRPLPGDVIISMGEEDLCPLHLRAASREVWPKAETTESPDDDGNAGHRLLWTQREQLRERLRNFFQRMDEEDEEAVRS